MKKVQGLIKLQVPAGKANPSPPVGPALGQHGVNIMEFCKSFNARTQPQMKDDLIIPVVITVYNDRSFTFITKTPPAAILLKKAAKIEKGSGEPNKNKVGKVTKAQVCEIAQLKLPDLNTTNLESAIRTIEGAARHGQDDARGRVRQGRQGQRGAGSRRRCGRCRGSRREDHQGELARVRLGRLHAGPHGSGRPSRPRARPAWADAQPEGRNGH